MKRIDYVSPEMEVINMKVQTNLLVISEGGSDPVIAPEPEDPSQIITD